MHLPVFFRLQINKIKCRSLKEILSGVGKTVRSLPKWFSFVQKNFNDEIPEEFSLQDTLSFEQFSHFTGH